MDKAEDIISKIFNIQGSSESNAYMKAHKNWQNILRDERLSDHCKLEDINGHSIRVSFDHPGWIQVFKMNQSMILKRMNNQYPDLKISSVSMFLKDDKLPPVQSSPENLRKDDTEEVKINGNLNMIKDDDLKERLENLKKRLQGK